MEIFFYNFVFRDVEPPGDSDGGDSPRDDQGDGSWVWMTEWTIFITTSNNGLDNKSPA